jgi:hypothetical protein
MKIVHWVFHFSWLMIESGALQIYGLVRLNLIWKRSSLIVRKKWILFDGQK